MTFIKDKAAFKTAQLFTPPATASSQNYICAKRTGGKYVEPGRK